MKISALSWLLSPTSHEAMSFVSGSMAVYVQRSPWPACRALLSLAPMDDWAAYLSPGTVSESEPV